MELTFAWAEGMSVMKYRQRSDRKLPTDNTGGVAAYFTFHKKLQNSQM